MDINYNEITRIQNPLLIGQQKPLDIRTYVNTLEETDTIQNPYIGLMFYCNEDGEYYKVTELKDGYLSLADNLVYPSKNATDSYRAIPNSLVKSYEKLVHGGGSGGGTNPDPGDPDDPTIPDDPTVPTVPMDPTIEYAIEYRLTNVTTTNTSKKIAQGFTYYTTLTPKANYVLESVVIKMGDNDVTNQYYSNGVINISAVSGNLVITASAKSDDEEEEPTTLYRVSYYLINFSAKNNIKTVAKGDSFLEELEMTGETNPTVNVTMNGQKIDCSLQNGKYTVLIPEVTGNINIMATSQLEGDYQPPEGEPDYYPPIFTDEETDDDYIWNYTIPNPNGIKYRELIGYLAACVCCNAFYSNTKENNKPFIKFKPLYQSRTFGTLKSRYYKEVKKERSSFIVKQVIVDTGSMNYYTREAGATEDEKVLVKIPFGTQDITDYIGAKLIGLEPWGYNLKFIGNPQFEYGDKFNVIDLEGNPFTVICYTSKLTYNGGLTHDMSGVKLKPGNITNSYLEEKIMSDIEVTQDDITKNIEALEALAKDLKDNDDNNKHTIGNMSGTVDGLKADVKNLKGTVRDHEGRIEELEEDIEGLTGSGNGSLNDLDNRVRDLENKINGNIFVDGLEKKVEDLEELVRRLTERIEALEDPEN